MSSIINYGISETLKSVFAQLKETPGLNGNKYHSKDVEQLSQDIVCRNYGSVCYELSFLCWAVVNRSQLSVANSSTTHPFSSSTTLSTSPLLNFFWVEQNIKPKAFRQAFSQPMQTDSIQLYMGDDYLHMQFDKSEFAISPTRIGVLAVMLEFIVNIEPAQLAHIEQSLIGASTDAIKQLSSRLQKLIYSYLKQHIPEASTQERFRAISNWLDQHQLTTETITDQDVLNFWLQPPAQPSYIKFSTVLEDLLDAVAAIEIVDNTLNADNASSIGNNLDQGELAPDWLQSNVFEQVTDAVDFSWLCQSPKFLTLAQYQPMKSLLNQTKMCQQLPLSFMRLAIFGAWQSVLVQAKRKSSQILANKLSQPPARQHQDYINELATCETQCKQVQAVIAYILYALRSPLFAGILLSQGPKILQQPLKKWLRQQVANTASPETDFFQPLQQWLLQHADGRAWLTQAELAFKNTNKMGFKTLPSLADVQIYQDGSEALTQCQQIIKQYLVAIERAMGEKTSLTEIYRSDLCIFSNRFKQLYGAASD